MIGPKGLNIVTVYTVYYYLQIKHFILTNKCNAQIKSLFKKILWVSLFYT